ncbi:MAG TPA: 2-oxoacid:acceptor oxidoreductase family protein, partial [Patescibacteria group bacterium]|nr:2-oxoacid:acceptor oxidoreductase family protein [Patescibacteria group bacterium]
MKLMTDIQWLIGGEAGYGIMTTGVMMSKIMTRLGLSVFDYVEYPSLIRGGHNAYYVRGSDQQIHSQKKDVEILVALNRQTIDLHKEELTEDAAIIYDSNSLKVQDGEFGAKQLVIPIPLIDFIKELNVDRLMVNTIAVGASLALFYDHHDILEHIMHDTFGKKGDEIVATNIKTSKKGFDFVDHNFANKFTKKFTKGKQESLLISGAEGVALGAIRSGMKFAAIYPMTPINGIITKITEHALDYSIVIKEPEDEISGINMAIGAG